jgi:hypothetical protein
MMEKAKAENRLYGCAYMLLTKDSIRTVSVSVTHSLPANHGPRCIIFHTLCQFGALRRKSEDGGEEHGNVRVQECVQTAEVLMRQRIGPSDGIWIFERVCDERDCIFKPAQQVCLRQAACGDM